MSKFLHKLTSSKQKTKQRSTASVPVPINDRTPTALPLPHGSDSSTPVSLPKEQNISAHRPALVSPVSSFRDSGQPIPESAPRIEIDFRTPAEQNVDYLINDSETREATYLLNGDNAQYVDRGEGGSEGITMSEKDLLKKLRYTPEQGALLWKVTGSDLRAIASVTRTSDAEFYRLLAIFSVSTTPSLLPKFPSLSTYFPPPTFVSSDHDWTADYIGYSGWIRDPRVLARLLRWVTKRIIDFDLAEQDAADNLPEWYKEFRRQEHEQNYPVNGFIVLLRPLIPPAYFEYLRNLFEQMALICANAAQNGASVQWTCGIFCWPIMGKYGQRSIQLARSDVASEHEIWEDFEAAWFHDRDAMYHLFLSWVRAQAPKSVTDSLPLLITNLVQSYEGAQTHRDKPNKVLVLLLEILNEVEDEESSARIDPEELALALLREAKYGPGHDISRWFLPPEHDDDGSSRRSTSTLLDILTAASLPNGDAVADLDPLFALRSNKSQQSKNLQTQTEKHRTFRKFSNASSITSPTTPVRLDRLHETLPQSAPAFVGSRKGSATMSVALPAHSAFFTQLAISSELGPGDSADPLWSDFAARGFGETDADLGPQLGTAFSPSGPFAASPGLRDNGSLRDSGNKLLAPSVSVHQASNRRKIGNMPGAMSIIGLRAVAIDVALLDFIEDTTSDSDHAISGSLPVLTALQVDTQQLELRRLVGRKLLVIGSRRRFKLSVITEMTAAPQLPPKESVVMPTPDPIHQRPLPAREASYTSTSQRQKPNRRASFFGLLSLNAASARKSSFSSAANTATIDGRRAVSSPVHVSLGNETQETQKPIAETSAIQAVPNVSLESSNYLAPLAPNRARSASGSQSLKRKPVPRMLDDILSESQRLVSSGQPVEGQLLAREPVQDPVSITGSDSKGNIVAVHHDSDTQSGVLQGLQSLQLGPAIGESFGSQNSPRSLASLVSTHDDTVMLSPDRGRRSGAPSPDLPEDKTAYMESVDHIPVPSVQGGGASSIGSQADEFYSCDHGMEPEVEQEMVPSDPVPAAVDHSYISGFALGPPISLPASPQKAESFQPIAQSSLEDGESEDAGPTFFGAMTAGAIAGVSVDFILYPLDTIKTRLQSRQGFLNAGGFKGIYRGVGSVGIGSAPGAAVFFTVYETLKKRLPQKVSTFASQPALTHMTAATVGEVASCLIRVPTEIVKSRMQTSAYGASSTSFSSAARLWTSEGIRGFYRGFGITLAREIPFTMIQFPLYEALKTQLSKRVLPGARKPVAYEAAGCGMIAGGIGAALTTPLDVVKTRAMLEVKMTGGSTHQTASVLSIPRRLAQIASEEGMKALFRGLVPRTSAICVGGAVYLGIYDLASNPGQLLRKEEI